MKVMAEVSEQLRKDPRFGAAMVAPIEIFGVDDFTESEVTIKARLKTVPMEQPAANSDQPRATTP
jgi:small conductance mechanosensitive channel